MANKLELNRKAVGRFLKSAPVQAAITDQAAPIRDRAEANAKAVTKRNEEVTVETKTYVGFDRARTNVALTSPAAIRAEQTNRALTRAIHAGTSE